MQEDYILTDVKEILGEKILSANAVERLDKINFKAKQIRDAHYMLIVDKALSESVNPLEDILQTIQSNNMEMQDYTATFVAKTSAATAFNSINSVSKWWTENLEGHSENLHDVFTVRFADTFVTMKIIEVIAEKKIVWEVTDCFLHWLQDKKEWKNTQVVFEILSEHGSVQIDFTHLGLVPAAACYNDCVKGWDQYIKGSLRKLITEGQGSPERKKTAAPNLTMQSS
jgi:hypothetical protein